MGTVMQDDTAIQPLPDSPTAVVLGGAGFIGRNVCTALAASGYSVHALGHGSLDSEAQRQTGITRWISASIDRGSMTELMAKVSPQMIVHCAGSGSVSSSYASPFEDFDRTVTTVALALDAARNNSQSPRVVIASSAAIYGDQGDIDLTESDSRAPMSPYGFHKEAAEMICHSFSRFFDVKVSVVRLFSVYGEGLRKQLLWDAMRKFDSGTNVFFGTGREYRDWIHVEDAAQLLVRAGSAAQGKFAIYNGGHVKATIREVLETMARHARVDLPLAFSGETHSGNPRRMTSDSRHARVQLQWAPGVGLDEGLARYVAWYRSRLTA